MDNSDSSRNLQQNLWRAIEMVMNSQLYTSNARSRFRKLAAICAAELGLIEDNVYRHLNTSIQIVSALYKKYLDQVQSQSPINNPEIIHFEHRLNFEEYDHVIAGFLRKFEDYTEKNLFPFSIGVFLHGSLATNDYTGFSDVDAGIFVKNEVMKDPKLLKKLKHKIKDILKLILKFDNLQHHGLFIIPEGFLPDYPEEYLPLEVFKYSKTIARSFRVKLRSRRNAAAARGKLEKMIQSLINYHQNPKSLYETKHKLSMMMLLPTLFLQAKENYVYKKFSFKIVEKEFQKEWWVIRQASHIRSKWVYKKSTAFSFLINISPNIWYPSTLFRKMNWHINKSLMEVHSKRLADGLESLGSKMITRVQDDD